MIRDVVIHVHNDQPMIADLYGLPQPGDVLLRCTNLRTKNGQRPVFADDQRSDFFFPMLHIRFLEVVPEPAAPGERVRAGSHGANGSGKPGEDDGELEIDEDFLRRIREV
ncbi:MAG: hypothetical protein ACJ761_12060 [Chloroflexota bacterium]